MKLNELAPRPGSRRDRKRVGRGIGSGTGKTSGRGHKGLKARSGSSTSGFEGGQMPLYRRLPKRGFKPPRQRRYAEVGLSRVLEAVAAGKIDPGKPIDAIVLRDAGLVRRVRDGVRLLGGATPETVLHLEVTGASRPAMAAVEQAGGRIVLIGPVRSSAESTPDRAEGDAPAPSEADGA